MIHASNILGVVKGGTCAIHTFFMRQAIIELRQNFYVNLVSNFQLRPWEMLDWSLTTPPFKT
jgi:hypothetical protein